MKKSDDIGELATALAQFQGSMTAVPKLSKNPFFKSMYADLPTIWEHIRGPLAANGLSILQACGAGEPFIYTDTDRDGKDKINVVHFIEIETMLMHNSGEWISDCCRLPLSKADPQGAGSGITYARRYGIAAVLGLVADDDDDGNGATGNQQPNNYANTSAPKNQVASGGNNPAMNKALAEAPKPEPEPEKKDVAAELAEIWGNGAAHASQSEILGICRNLAAAGDASLTGHKKVADYVMDRFDEPLAKISAKSVKVLIAELTERLEERRALADGGDGDDSPSNVEAISDQQLTTIRRLCDLKNYAEKDCAIEYSNGGVDKLENLSAEQAAEAIKKVQRMAKVA